MVDEGVRRAYTHPDNILRASIVDPPFGARRNTGDNTPAIVHTELVPGDRLEVQLAAKGGGSENKARFAILNPSASVVDWVLEQVPRMGAGWCPPGILGLGIGGSAEKAMLMAKAALLKPIDIHELKARGPSNALEEMRLEIHEKVNALGIGAQGLGGLTTVLDVQIQTFPTHAASLPVALIPNCAATRHCHFTLDGSGPAQLAPPSLDSWPRSPGMPPPAPVGSISTASPARRSPLAAWRASAALRQAADRPRCRPQASDRDPQPRRAAARGRRPDQPLPLLCRPRRPGGDEVVGPAGPTTATRMDRFTDQLLEQTGLIGMIGKAERGPEAIEAIRRHRAVYLIAIGGAAYLVSKAIKSARLVAFEDLGMEAIREFEVEDMPVTVAVDSQGVSVHGETGPQQWRSRIAEIPVKVE